MAQKEQELARSPEPLGFRPAAAKQPGLNYVLGPRWCA
jgi:hypothetical protein